MQRYVNQIITKVLSYFLSTLPNDEILITYRKHAFIVISIIAAVITPTADIFTLLLVTCPIMLLYETSILIVGRTSN